MKRCDIVIPCYNSASSLNLTLEALLSQTVPPGWEVCVVIVDDGSTDSTIQQAKDVLQSSSWLYTILEQSHQGISQARNQGLAVATGFITLFINADMVLQPGTLAAHLHFHDQHPAIQAAALGLITWDPRVQPSPLMEWLTHGGPQNNFDALLGQTVADARHFFTAAHVSLKRALLTQHQFAPQFTWYGWEDSELGYRLAAQGLQLSVLPAAKAWHHHYYSVAAVTDRQQAVGRGLHIYQQLHPDAHLGPIDSHSRQLKHQLFLYTGSAWLLDRLVALLGGRYSWPWLFQLWTSWHFWHGYRAKDRLL